MHRCGWILVLLFGIFTTANSHALCYIDRCDTEGEALAAAMAGCETRRLGDIYYYSAWPGSVSECRTLTVHRPDGSGIVAAYDCFVLFVGFFARCSWIGDNPTWQSVINYSLSLSVYSFSQPSCRVSGLTVSPSSVVPQGTAGNNTANVVITLTSPAPASGCKGRVRVEPVEFSGGHNHDGNRKDHTGSLDHTVFTLSSGESTASVTYTSGEVGGQEKIIVEMLDGNGNVSSTKQTTVDVKVEGLQPLGAFVSYQLTGSREAHPTNHYGTASTVTNIGGVADDYYIEAGELLGINDMSLVWGGLFDIGPPPASNVFWYAPHTSHRKGTSVDIDLCALSTIPNDPNPQTCVVAYDENDAPIYHTCTTNNYVCVPADEIVRLCRKNGNAIMANELTHHCEFPQ